jgi:hypothetical protein
MARTKLGPLALESRLGDPSGNVWRAIHVAQRKSAVVKLFHIPFGATPEVRSELAREWENLKQVRADAVARCYGGGFEGNDAYLAYEWLDGETLDAVVARRERLPWDLVIDYADHLVDGLGAAHERHIFHGSLEPDKLMCILGGGISILDLRAERFSSRFRSERPPTSFQLAFRPPELLVRNPIPTVKSDLYSMGAVLYYALTGIPPFQGQSLDAVAEAIRTVRPAKVDSLVMDCPVWFSALVDQLLQKDPQGRPYAASAVKIALFEIRQKCSDRVAVTEHAAGGFSALRMEVDRSTARELLGRVEAKPRKVVEEEDESSLFEKWWFLLGSLLVLIGLIVWLMLPPSIDSLRNKAERLLATDDWSSWKTAKSDYLEPILRRDPEGLHGKWAGDKIDEIDMRGAEIQLDNKLRLGRPLKEEAERLYAAARRYEQFDDRMTALDKYRAMTKLLDPEKPEHRPFYYLAMRRIAAIEGAGTMSTERYELVQRRLMEAEGLLRTGKTIEARVMLESIVELYREHAEVRSQVERAEELLSQKR